MKLKPAVCRLVCFMSLDLKTGEDLLDCTVIKDCVRVYVLWASVAWCEQIVVMATLLTPLLKHLLLGVLAELWHGRCHFVNHLYSGFISFQ